MTSAFSTPPGGGGGSEILQIWAAFFYSFQDDFFQISDDRSRSNPLFFIRKTNSRGLESRKFSPAAGHRIKKRFANLNESDYNGWNSPHTNVSEREEESGN